VLVEVLARGLLVVALLLAAHADAVQDVEQEDRAPRRDEEDEALQAEQRRLDGEDDDADEDHDRGEDVADDDHVAAPISRPWA
jgi:hypothetical protein